MPRRDRSFTQADSLRFWLRNLSRTEQAEGFMHYHAGILELLKDAGPMLFWRRFIRHVLSARYPDEKMVRSLSQALEKYYVDTGFAQQDGNWPQYFQLVGRKTRIVIAEAIAENKNPFAI